MKQGWQGTCLGTFKALERHLYNWSRGWGERRPDYENTQVPPLCCMLDKLIIKQCQSEPQACVCVRVCVCVCVCVRETTYFLFLSHEVRKYPQSIDASTFLVLLILHYITILLLTTITNNVITTKNTTITTFTIITTAITSIITSTILLLYLLPLSLL